MKTLEKFLYYLDTKASQTLNYMIYIWCTCHNFFVLLFCEHQWQDISPGHTSILPSKEYLVRPLITARKRSLGQGNIFIGVCREFCSQWGVSAPGGSAPGGVRGKVCSWGGVCSKGGCLVPGGAWSQGVPAGDAPGRLLLQAVRILLECILVENAKVTWGSCGSNGFLEVSTVHRESWRFNFVFEILSNFFWPTQMGHPLPNLLIHVVLWVWDCL